MHQREQPPLSQERRGVNAQLTIVRGSLDDLLATVAKDVGTQNRRGLGAKPHLQRLQVSQFGLHRRIVTLEVHCRSLVRRGKLRLMQPR